MEIRWEKRDQNAEPADRHARLVAVLVEAHSGSNGHRENVIARLGSIEERFLEVNIAAMRNFHKGLFWTVVDKKLDELGLSVEQRSAIENGIAERIPRPCAEWALWGVTCIPRFDDK